VKIAISTHNIVRGDGQGRVAFELARHALRRGHRVSLLADHVAPELVEAGAEWIPVHPAISRIHLLKVPLFARLANRVIAANEFDVVHGFGFSLDCPHGISSAQFVHDAWGRCPAHPLNGKWTAKSIYQQWYTYWNKRWERSAFAKAGLVVACSSLTQRDLMAIGVAERKIRVIPNGVDLHEYLPGVASRGALGLPEGVPLALFVGDIRTTRKNLDAVLGALQRRPGVHLAVAGAVPGSPYPALAKALGLAQRVHFLGFRTDIGELMRAADVFVFPSLYEPFGLVVTEALATGLPVITVATVGAADIVREGGGIVVEDGRDEIALAEAMSRILDSPDQAGEMRKAARQSAEHSSWDQMAIDYFEEYESVFQRGIVAVRAPQSERGNPVNR
jgi:glycosyltransferase involved in cell wall biosynthesis